MALNDAIIHVVRDEMHEPVRRIHVFLLTIITNHNNNKCQTTKKQTFAKPLSWEKELSVIIFLSKHQARRVSVIGRENSTSLPDSKHTPFYYYYYYFLPNDSTHYETFILSSSTSSACGDIVAVPRHFFPFVC